MLDPKKLSKDVLNGILSNLGYYPDGKYENEITEEEALRRLSRMDPGEAFEAYCTWHGLIDWADRLTDAIDSIRGREEV